MRPRRIAYIDHAAVLSGGEVALCNLLNFLDHEKWQPMAILGADGPLVRRLTEADVPVEVLPLPAILSEVRQGEIGLATILNPLRSGAGLAYVASLARALRRQQVDLIHANSLRASILAGLASRVTGIPSVWQIHSVVGSSLMSKTGLRLLRRLARHLPNHIICNSRTTARDFETATKRLSVIPCGVDSTRFAPNGIAVHDRPRVGMIARFAPLKGQHVLVDAARLVAAKHPEVEFVMAGTPLFGEEVYAQEVQETAQRTLRRHIRFLGFVEDVPALLHELDVVVNPSVMPEGFGQAIVEAMMAGKPVIASALGGPVDVIEDGVSGRLVPAGDPVALAGAIDEMLSDPAASAEMGLKGRARAVERYDIRETTRNIEEVYGRVLSGR